MLQFGRNASISSALIVARTGEDLHDYVLFADRPIAFDAYAGCCIGPLRPNSASADRDT